VAALTAKISIVF